MNKRLLIAVAVAVLATAQAAWAQPATVTVRLVGSDIRVDPDPVFVEASMGRGVAIRWQIAPDSDAVFDPTGIRIDGEKVGGGLRPQTQIHSCSGGPKHVVCRNENSKKGDFKYTVRLLDANRNPIPPKDPVIVNR